MDRARIVAALRTVRGRATLGAVAIVTAALAISTVGVVVLLERRLIENIEEAALQRAEDIANLLRADPGGPLPVRDVEDVFVQIVGPNGTVIRASDNLSPLSPAVARVEPGELTTIDEAPLGDDEGPFRVAAASTSIQSEPAIVLVGQSMEPAIESGQALRSILLYGAPLLLGVIGLITWRTVGAALEPVDNIRGEVASISDGELHRRVPVPGTGDEISRLATTMNAMLDRLQAARDNQKRFVSDASHELKSPIASIRQHSELALQHPERTTLEELAQIVLAENLRLQRLVEDLLLLAQVDEGRLSLDLTVIDLDDIVFEEAARHRNAGQVTVDTTGVSGARLRGDRRKLAMVVRNLMENAARHATRTVRLGLTQAEEEIVMTVEDDGPGVPEADRTEIFERFRRLDEARARSEGGAGLGLAIVAEIVGAHSGRVSVHDSALGGASFVVKLPGED